MPRSPIGGFTCTWPTLALISVPADSDIEDFGQLLEALQTSDEPLTVATAGLTSAGAIAMGAIEGAAEINYRQIVYEGGNPAVIATVAGETDFTSQTATEQVDMIRAERLRPLAVIASSPLELDGYGTVPPVTEWLPDVQSANNYFGIWIPADAPQEVLDTMDAVWENTIMNSDAMRAFAAERGALFDPSYGDAAQEAAMPMLSINAWQQYDGGTAENSPEDFGIPRP
jgi:tripartite-type tricarboxylate transporter receptor subunit TctC